jgi:hypothetical protein
MFLCQSLDDARLLQARFVRPEAPGLVLSATASLSSLGLRAGDTLCYVLSGSAAEDDGEEDFSALGSSGAGGSKARGPERGFKGSRFAGGSGAAAAASSSSSSSAAVPAAPAAAPKEWACNMCTFINKPTGLSCETCGSVRGSK